MKVGNLLIDAYIKRVNPGPCPLCANTKWSISSTMFHLFEFNEGNIIIGGDQTSYPVVPIVCTNCGNTYFINALVAGLLKPNDNASSTDDT